MSKCILYCTSDLWAEIMSNLMLLKQWLLFETALIYKHVLSFHKDDHSIRAALTDNQSEFADEEITTFSHQTDDLH